MKRNSTTLLLTSPGATTPIPWVNNAPDFSAFTEPTLSVLQKAWQDFVDSGAELEVIPDPEPAIEPVTPDWKDFNFALFTDNNFVAYGLAAQSVNPYLVPALVERYAQIAKIGLPESGFADYWSAFCASLGVIPEHREAWATLAESYNLPTDFIIVIRG